MMSGKSFRIKTARVTRNSSFHDKFDVKPAKVIEGKRNILMDGTGFYNLSKERAVEITNAQNRVATKRVYQKVRY